MRHAPEGVIYLDTQLILRGANTGPIAHTFSNLMFTGKCKAALKLLSNAQKGGVLHDLHDHIDPNDPTSLTVQDVLVEKHPPPQPATNDCFLQEETEIPHPVIFESIDASVICSAALKVTKTAGPSGLDAHQCRRFAPLTKAHPGT